MIDLGNYPTPSDPVLELFLQLYPVDNALRRLLLNHSLSVGKFALELADPQELDLRFVAEASLLHDIGISRTRAPGIHCTGDLHYLWHGVIGRQDCDEVGLMRHGLVCERHVGTGLTASEARNIDVGLPLRDMLPITPEERVICYADQFFSKTSQEKLSLTVVREKVGRHGADPLDRFECLHQEFADG